MAQTYYIQLSGIMLSADGAFYNGLFDNGKVAEDTPHNQYKAVQLTLYLMKKIDDSLYYMFSNGTTYAPVTAKGPLKTGFYINGEKTNIANYNESTKFVFKVLGEDSDTYKRYYDDLLIDEIGQQYNIVTPAGTYTLSITSGDSLKILNPSDVPIVALREFDVYSVKWPPLGEVLNTLTTDDGLSSFRSDAEGGYYTTFSPNQINLRYPILVSVVDNNGTPITTIEGNGIKIGEFLGDEGGGAFSYSSESTVVYDDDTYRYYPYLQGFVGPEPDNYATVKRVHKTNNGIDIWDKTNSQWNVLVYGNDNGSGGGSGDNGNGGGSGDNGSGGGSGGGSGNNQFLLTIGSMNFDLSDGNGNYLFHGTYISSDDQFDYSMYINDNYVTTEGNFTMYTVYRSVNTYSGNQNGWWNTVTSSWET